MQKQVPPRKIRGVTLCGADVGVFASLGRLCARCSREAERLLPRSRDGEGEEEWKVGAKHPYSFSHGEKKIFPHFKSLFFFFKRKVF